MKKCALFLIYSLIAGIITSCLGDSNQTLVISNQPGVVIKDGSNTKVMLKDSNVIYSENLAGYSDGNCLILKYKIDYGLSANADSGRKAGGYYTVEVLDPIVEVPVFEPVKGVDTISTLFRNERTIRDLQERSTFIRDRLFLFTEHAVDSFQLENKFVLEYGKQEPQPDTLYGVSKSRVYHVYLRVYKNTDETERQTETPDKIYFNAFNLSEIAAAERQKGEDSIFFKIKYVASFRDTTAVASWNEKDFSFSLYSRRK